ncbi:MAG TPA: VCBS repeat-containing protein, partial [Gemmata sp.]|nr:VCBS repeat-containing protein [Gemmata sp.]
GANRGLSVALSDIIPNFAGQEFITGTGPGTQALVRVWDQSGNLLTSFKPFGQFSGGVFVATGDINNDGQNELIVSTGAGTTGRVKVFQYSGGGLQTLGRFDPFGPNYSGGVDIAVGDVTGDRASEIVVGQQSQGSQVKVFAITSSPSGGGSMFVPIRTFNPYGKNFTGGVSLAAANIDARRDTSGNPYEFNYAEIITGKASQEPRIKIFDAQLPTVTLRASYMAFDSSFGSGSAGVNVAAGSTDGRRGAEIYVASKSFSRIRIFDGESGIQLGEVFPFIGTSRMTNMAIGSTDDDFLDIYNVANLVVVRADGPYGQAPLVYPGQLNSPAGLNGSFFA